VNEVARIEQPSADVRAYRASTEAADICKEIVVACSSTIQGRRFVSVEGWSAIAVAHGCTLSARDVERVDGGVRAIGEVRRMSDGQLIATGEGFVGEDETTWYGGKDRRGKVHDKRNDYAIRAMAQTRAMSRAGRTAFAHVVVMMKAGLATTPAEEMVAFDGATGEIIEPAAERQKVPGIHKIKERLNKFMLAGNACTDLEEFRKMVKENKDDIKAIREGNHEYWTGDGEDSEGFAAWMERRYAELAPHTDSTEFQLLASLVQEAKSYDDLRSIIDEHDATIAKLEGDESRRFDLLYNNRESDLAVPAAKSPTPLEAGAFGG
jgi:hypothetical protein